MDKKTLAITPERLKAVNGKFFVWQSVYKPGTNPPSYDVTLLQSSDGINWTDTGITSTNAIFGMQSLTDIAYGNNKYVVSANNAVYYTSTNLINWTTVTLTDLVINHYNSSWPYVTNVIYLNNRFFSYIVTPYAKKYSPLQTVLIGPLMPHGITSNFMGRFFKWELFVVWAGCNL